ADHPIAYWPMDDSSSPLTDATGNGNNGVYGAGVSFNAPSVLPGFPSDPSVSFSGSQNAYLPTRKPGSRLLSLWGPASTSGSSGRALPLTKASTSSWKRAA